MSKIISVKYKGNNLDIPYRVYNMILPGFASNFLPLALKIKLYKRLTRHHDGFIREKFIKKLIKISPDVAIPYAIQLSSEYVLDIILVVYNNREKFDKKLLACFIRANQEYLKKSKDRMTSYWDCYYRNKYPRLKAYTGFKLYAYFKKISLEK